MDFQNTAKPLMEPASSNIIQPRPLLLSWLSAHWPLWSGILLLTIFYWDVLFGSNALLYRDMIFVYWPTRMNFADRLLSGEFPEWYPYDGLGSSYVGNVVTAILHPSIILHLIFSHTVALSLSAILSHFIAGAGIFFLLRHWGCGKAAGFIGAIAYSCSGYLMSMDGNLPYLLAASAIPWAIFFSEKTCETLQSDALSLFAEASTKKNIPLISSDCLPWLAATAAAMACLSLSGDPQALIITSIFLLCLALFRPKQQRVSALGRLLIAGIVTFLTAAAQLLPALSATEVRTKTATMLAQNREWSLNPVRLLYFFCPGTPFLPNGEVPNSLFNTKTFNSFWSDSLFLGAAVLSLALLAIRCPGTQKKAAGVMACFGTASLAISLGADQNAPVYGLLQNFPGWNLLRYPEKTVVFVTLSLATLAGLGFERLLRCSQNENRLVWGIFQKFLIFFAGISLILMLSANTNAFRFGVLALAGGPPEAMDEVNALIPQFQTVLLWGFLFSLITLCISAFAARSRTTISKVFIGLAVAAPLFITGIGMSNTRHRASPEKILAPSQIVQEIRNTWKKMGSVGSPRVYTNDDSEILDLISTSLPSFKLNHIQASRLRSHDMAHGGGLFHIESAVGYLPMTAQGRQRHAAEALPDVVFWNGFRIDAAVEGNPKMTDLESALHVIPNPNAAPRIRLVRGIPVANMEGAVQITQTKSFDITKELPVETNDSSYPETAPVNAKIHVETYQPEHIIVKTYSDTASTLFIADGFARGWSATIDKIPTDIFPGLIAGRAIGVPAGSHQVELIYRTPGLRLGLALSILGWMTILVMFFTPAFIRWKNRRNNKVINPS